MRVPSPPAFSDAQLLEYLAFAGELADAAARVILPLFRAPLKVDDKCRNEGFDPVTEADRSGERVMREMIGARYPGHGILGEEFGHRHGRNSLTWVLDPIDGTRSFITGMPLWGVLIALNDGKRPILGVMEQPYTGERFAGSRLGATLTGRDGHHSLAVRRCPELAQAVLLSTHPDLFQRGSERDAFQSLAERVRMTRFGGDCYAYCMLAHGFVDLVVESGLQPYDIQALIPIIEGAGGVVTDWRGDPAWNGGQVLAAGDAHLHQATLELLAAVLG
jgi:myo-inositol-1(or 4)-monophosphatase